jgi:hypothetical protein
MISASWGDASVTLTLLGLCLLLMGQLRQREFWAIALAAQLLSIGSLVASGYSWTDLGGQLPFLIVITGMWLRARDRRDIW